MAELNEAALSPDDNVIPRIRFSDVGVLGLKIAGDSVVEEASRKMRFPEFYRIVDEMKKDATIATGTNFIRTMISDAEWHVKCNPNYSDKAKERSKFLMQCMNDMEHSWASFISEVTSYHEYGYAIHEKAFRYRLKRNGSRYNDGLVGLKSLNPRAQSTIIKHHFDETGSKLVAVTQTTANSSTNLLSDKLKESEIKIPRERFLLFTCDSRLNNPLGNSPLKSIYLAWQTRRSIEEQELVALARDLNGIPYVSVPAAIMSDNASDGQKAQYEYAKNMARNLHANRQAGIVFPSDVDENTKTKYFDIKLLSTESGSTYDVNKIIERINNQILTALSADVLTIGQSGTGSFSLADSKVSLTEFAIRHRLKEIKDVLNHDLIPALWRMNGWDMDELPEFDFEMPDTITLAEWAKSVQQLAATSNIERTRSFFNMVNKKLGLPLEADNKKVDWETVVIDMASRSGDGMAAGMNSGTSSGASTSDNSSTNLDKA